MKIGFIGKSNHISRSLETMFGIDYYENPEDKIGENNLYLFNPYKMEHIPKLDIPEDSVCIYLFKVGETSADLFRNANLGTSRVDFLIEYPGMTNEYIVKKFEQILLKRSAFTSTERKSSNSTSMTISTIEEKNKWLGDFQSQLDKDKATSNSEFKRRICTIADELILNSFIHGYKADPNNFSENEIGTVKINWALNNISFELRVEDDSNSFNVFDFIEKQKTTKSANEISENKTGGLGYLLAINFVDHVEIDTGSKNGTSVTIYINLNRNLYSKLKKQRRASLLLSKYFQ